MILRTAQGFFRHHYWSFHRQELIAWMCTRLVMFFASACLPLFSFRINDYNQFIYLWEIPVRLFEFGIFFWVVAILIICTCFLLPVLYQFFFFLNMAIKQYPNRKKLGFIEKFATMHSRMRSWKMLDIFLVSALIAAIKINDMVPLQIQFGGICLIFYTYLNGYIFYTYERKKIKEKTEKTDFRETINRKENTQEFALTKQITLAYLLTGIILFFPANFLPMITITRFAKTESYTILGGVLDFMGHGMWFLAGIVFIASFLIPILKFAGLLYLLLKKSKKNLEQAKIKVILYRTLEIIGKWSMIDVFVVGVLIASVRLQKIAFITPGPGTVFFAGMVIFTMIATMKYKF